MSGSLDYNNYIKIVPSNTSIYCVRTCDLPRLEAYCRSIGSTTRLPPDSASLAAVDSSFMSAFTGSELTYGWHYLGEPDLNALTLANASFLVQCNCFQARGTVHHLVFNISAPPSGPSLNVSLINSTEALVLDLYQVPGTANPVAPSISATAGHVNTLFDVSLSAAYPDSEDSLDPLSIVSWGPPMPTSWGVERAFKGIACAYPGLAILWAGWLPLQHSSLLTNMTSNPLHALVHPLHCRLHPLHCILPAHTLVH